MMKFLPLTLSAVVLVGGAFATVGLAHAEKKAKTPPVKIASIHKKTTRRAAATRKPPAAKTPLKYRRAKLPREWVWKKYTKSFDHMFRTSKKK